MPSGIYVPATRGGLQPLTSPASSSICRKFITAPLGFDVALTLIVIRPGLAISIVPSFSRLNVVQSVGVLDFAGQLFRFFRAGGQFIFAAAASLFAGDGRGDFELAGLVDLHVPIDPVLLVRPIADARFVGVGLVADRVAVKIHVGGLQQTAPSAA